jgi:hypothetical protein
MQVFLTFAAVFTVLTVCFLIGFFAGRAFERSRIRAENRGDVTTASAGGGSDW